MKKLIIAEKPSLAMEIVKAIGKMNRNDGYFENESYIVSFAFGHLMVLQDIDDYYKREKTKWIIEELPFVPQAFLFKIRNDVGVIKQYNILKNLIKREDVTHIVNCGDADREGEVIINNIIYKALYELKLKKDVERLWLKSINQEEIQNSLSRLKPIFETKNLYNEGLARTYLDWLYGINLTRYVSIKAGDLLPVGRVLTPIVKKVYDRKKEIENFVPENYVELEVIIKKDEQELKATVKNSKFKAPIDRDKIKELVKALNSADSIVTDKQIKSVEKKPKKLFSLTTLQNHMVKNHKMTLEDTLKHVQSLYEKGYVTYPRTNTEYLHTSEIEDVKKLVETYAASYDIVFKNTKALFDDSKVESHSALLPTVKRTDGRNFNEFEKQVYEVIFSRFLANFCKEKTIVEETKIQIKTLDYITELKGNSIKQLGFYKYEKPDSKEKLLPYFELNEIVDAEYIDADKETSPPKLLTLVEMNNYLKNPFKEERRNRNNESSSDASAEETASEEDEDKAQEDADYAQMLKGIEIGTVATRDSIIGNAVKYSYITENKTVLDITEKGIYLIEALEKLTIDMSKEKTVETSIILKDIYRSERTVQSAIQATEAYFKELMSQDITIQKISRTYPDREIIGKCPKCGKNIYEHSKAYYCEGYKDEPKCNFSIWKDNKFFKDKGKKLTKTMAKKLIALQEIEVKKLKSKEGKEYDAFIKIRLPIEQYVNFEMRF